MNKTVFFALAALAGLAVSCSEKPESGPEDEKQTYNTPESESCFYAAFANPADMLVWSKGDAVAVWEEGGSRSAYTAQSDGSSTILEGAATSKGSTYRALLPDDPGIALSGAEISFDIPDNQAPVKGGVAYNPAVALTTGTHRDFRFYGICGLVGFSLFLIIKDTSMTGKAGGGLILLITLFMTYRFFAIYRQRNKRQ